MYLVDVFSPVTSMQIPGISLIYRSLNFDAQSFALHILRIWFLLWELILFFSFPSVTRRLGVLGSFNVMPSPLSSKIEYIFETLVLL